MDQPKRAPTAAYDPLRTQRSDLPFAKAAIMTTRVATCRCGQLRAICFGEPVRVSVCHCLECQKRTGSAFSVQARWPNDGIDLTGDHKSWSRTTDSGSSATYRFCPICGSTLACTREGMSALRRSRWVRSRFPPSRLRISQFMRNVSTIGLRCSEIKSNTWTRCHSPTLVDTAERKPVRQTAS